MSLTVSELLALEGLSALRLRAGKQGLQRAVRWYYVAENEHIAEWIMGGELVFITGINHPRDEANLIQLLMEGKQRGIAGMVILTGEAYIHAIPATLIALADELGMPLIEQPYLLKMVIVTERIGTALVRNENVLQSQRDVLMQLVTGDYPDLQMLHQRALHQQLDFTRPLRLAALRLEGLSRLFRQFPPEQAEAWLLQAHRSVRQQLQQQLNQQGNSFPLLERSNMFLFLLPDEEGEGFQQKNGYSSGCRRWRTERRVCRCSAASPRRSGSCRVTRGRCRRRARRWICAIPCGQPSASATISSWGLSNCCPRSATRRCSTILCTTPSAA